MLSLQALRRAIPTPSSSRSANRRNTEAEALSEQSEKEQLASHIAVVRCAESDAAAVYGALTALRRAVSAQLNPPIGSIVDLGGVEALLQRLGDGSTCSPAAQYEAAWVLTNLATGTTEQTLRLMDAGAVEKLFQTLLSKAAVERPELCSQCIWALGNIAGEGVEFRDRLLSAGIVGVLGQLYEQLPSFPWQLHFRTEVLRSLTWLMSSLCKGSPAPALEEVDCTFDYFAQVLQGTEDPQMLGDALWGLSYLLEGAAACDEEGQLLRGNRLLSAGFSATEVPLPPAQHPTVVRVVECARWEPSRSPAPVPALRILGHMVSLSSPHFSDVALTAGCLKAFKMALEEHRMAPQVRSDAAHALANIAAGTPAQVQHLLKVVGRRSAWDVILREMPDAPADVKREAAWAVANMMKAGDAVISKIDGKHALTAISALLRWQPEPALHRALLEGVEAILSSSSQDQMLLTKIRQGMIEETGFPRVLEELKQTDRKAQRILSTWFEVDQENAPPIDMKMSPNSKAPQLKRPPLTPEQGIVFKSARQVNKFGGA